MTVSTGKSYRVRHVCRLHWASWNDEYVVFDEASGQTHQLDAVRAFVLDLLSEDPQTFSDIFFALASPQLIPESGSLNKQLTTILTEFEAVGLIEAAEQ